MYTNPVNSVSKPAYSDTVHRFFNIKFILVHFESHNRQRSLIISILQTLKDFIKALLTLTEIYISHIHVLIKVDAISRFLFQQLTIIITIAKMIMLWNIFKFHDRFTSH